MGHGAEHYRYYVPLLPKGNTPSRDTTTVTTTINTTDIGCRYGEILGITAANTTLNSPGSGPILEDMSRYDIY